jgi:hypothetical protein
MPATATRRQATRSGPASSSGPGPAYSHVWSAYSGTTAAPFAGIQEDGVRLRLVAGYGADSYSGPRAVGAGSQIIKFNGTASFADALLGYHKQLGPLTLKVFAGLTATDRQIRPDDPETVIHGLGFGGKVALETWWNVGDQAWTSVDLSWGSLYQSYAARARLGWRFMPALSAGLEAGAVGNLECDIVRVGGFVRYELASGGSLRRRSNDKLRTAAVARHRAGERALRHALLADALLTPPARAAFTCAMLRAQTENKQPSVTTRKMP